MTLLLPPYGLNWTQGSYTNADRNTGRLTSWHSTIYAGVFQNVAQVGSAFYGPSGTRRIRVEARVTVNSYRLWTPAALGYASSEAILNLRVMDGSNVVAHDRRSLARALAVVFWNTELKGGPFTLTMATEFSGGGGRQYSAHVDVETWIGSGGLAAASADCFATVHQIDTRAIS